MNAFSAARRKMVDNQVRPSNVTNLRVIEAMLDVPRELFVPDDQVAMAYLDKDVLLSAPGAPMRWMLRPAIVARLLQAADINQGDRVLVVGCGAGYTAAVAAQLGTEIAGVESDPALAKRAIGLFATIPIRATIAPGPLPDGLAELAPFDVIIMEGAAEIVPTVLFDQLKMAGRLAGLFAVGDNGKVTQQARLYTRSPGDFGFRVLFDVKVPILPGFERHEAFAF